MMMHIQPDFQALTDASLAAARAALGQRLSAFYLHGSVAQGDAVPYVSDLDAMLILQDCVTDADRAWQQQAQAQLHLSFPIAEEIHLNLLSESDLAGNSFACFALRCNASLLFGRDVAASLPCPAPDASMARSRLDFARQCFADALAGKQPACTGPLPDDPYFRARKFARYFVIIEGAYFLMAQGRFTSFRKEAVLSALHAALPQFAPALSLTESVLDNAQAARVHADAFLRSIEPLTCHFFDSIGAAPVPDPS